MLLLNLLPQSLLSSTAAPCSSSTLAGNAEAMRLALLLTVAAVSGLQFQAWEFDELVAGKGVLLQLAVHDQAANDTRAKWRALSDHFRASSEVFVGRLFCDDVEHDGEALCGELINGRLLSAFPSVFYGDPYELSEYAGAKTLDALRALGESVRAPCSPARRDRCDDAARRKLDAYERMAPADLDELLATVGVAHLARVDAAEDALTRQRADLLAEWDAHEDVLEQRVARVEARLRTMYEVAVERDCLPPAPPPSDAADEGTYAADGLAGGYVDGAYADDYDDLFDDVDPYDYYDAGAPPPTLYYDGDPYYDEDAYLEDGGYYETQSYRSSSEPRR